MAVAAQEPETRNGRHDPAVRRKSIRKQREKGCSIYITADDLRRAGIPADGLPPLYRVWAGRRRGLTITLYRAEESCPECGRKIEDPIAGVEQLCPICAERANPEKEE